jgi:hypothetical protein
MTKQGQGGAADKRATPTRRPSQCGEPGQRRCVRDFEMPTYQNNARSASNLRKRSVVLPSASIRFEAQSSSRLLQCSELTKLANAVSHAGDFTRLISCRTADLISLTAIPLKYLKIGRKKSDGYLAPGPADRKHHLIYSPRRTASPLRPSLSSRYTQVAVERLFPV